MKVDQDILAVLDAGRAEGRKFFLPPDQLERTVYVRVNRVLELAGGVWSRSEKAHVFDSPAEERLEALLLTGVISDAKKEFQFFETTAPVVNRILHRAQLTAESRVLEPSAGHGAIALRAAETAKEVVCIELNDYAVKALRERATPNMIVHHATDFLEAPAQPIYSHVLMNPPFSKGQDAKHILRAFDWLQPGGVLVAVASAGVTFRKDAPYQKLRDLIAREDGEIEDLPAGSFQSSGTDVNTVLIVIRR